MQHNITFVDLVPEVALDLPPDSRKFLEKQLFPTLIPALEKLLTAIENTTINAEGRLISRPKMRPLNPIHFLACYLMRHNPNPQFHSWAEKQAFDVRKQTILRARAEAERLQRIRMEEEATRKRVEEQERRRRQEEEELRRQEELKKKMEEEEEERKRLEDIRRKQEEEERRKRMIEEERRKREDEERKRKEEEELKKKQKDEAERLRREREEEKIRKQREKAQFDNTVMKMNAIVKDLQFGDDIEKTIASLFGLALEAARRLGRANTAYLHMLDPPPDRLVCVAHVDEHQRGTPVDRDNGHYLNVLFAVADNNKAINLNDFNDGHGRRGQLYAAPIRAPSAGVIGTLGAESLVSSDSAASPPPFIVLPSDDVNRLQTLADCVGACLESLRKKQQLHEKEGAIRGIKALLDTPNTSKEAVWREAVEVVKQFTLAACVYLARMDHPNLLRLIACDQSAEEALGLAVGQVSIRPPGKNPPFSDFNPIDNRGPLIIKDLGEMPDNELYGRPDNGTYLGAPAVDIKSSIVGVLGILRGSPEDEFTPEDADFAEKVLMALGPSFENPTLSYIKQMEAFLAEEEGNGNVPSLLKLLLPAFETYTTAAAAYVAVFEGNPGLLSYVGATASQEALMVGRRVPRPVPKEGSGLEAGSGVSWSMLDQAKPTVLFVEDVRKEPLVKYFRGDLDDLRKNGSYAAVPLFTKDGECFGLLGMDSLGTGRPLRDWDLRILETLGRALGPAYERIERRRRMLPIVEGGYGICRQLLGPSSQFVFGNRVPSPKDLPGRSLLAVTAAATGRPYGYLVVDGDNLDTEKQAYLALMTRLFGMAFDVMYRDKISQEPSNPDGFMLEMQKKSLMEYLRLLVPALLLKVAREEIMNLDVKWISEIKSYQSPPKVVHKVLKSVFYVLGHLEKDVDGWGKCRALIGDDLKTRIAQYDPTAVQKKAKYRLVAKTLKGLSAADVQKHGSAATEKMFSWVQFIIVIHKSVVEAQQTLLDVEAAEDATEDSQSTFSGVDDT